MTESLIGGASARFAAFWLPFLLVAAWEALRPYRTLDGPVARRWARNLGTYILNLAILAGIAALAPAAMDMAADAGARETSLGALTSWTAILLWFAILDGVHYGLHRLFHAVPLLWRLHRLHHADIELDVTTGVRHHPGEFLVQAATVLAFAAVAQVPAEALALYVGAATALQLLQHGNVALPPRLARMLRSVLVTPEHHSVHHSVREREGNSNFGTVFSFWDRLFGTFIQAPQNGHEALTFGVGGFRDPSHQRWPGMMLLPFRPQPEAPRTR